MKRVSVYSSGNTLVIICRLLYAGRRDSYTLMTPSDVDRIEWPTRTILTKVPHETGGI